MKLIYHLTDAGRASRFVETGIDPQRQQALAVNPIQLDAEDRAFLAQINPALTPEITLQVTTWLLWSETRSPYTVAQIQTDASALLAGYRAARATGAAEVLVGLNAKLNAAIAALIAWDSERQPDSIPESLFDPTGRVAALRAAHAEARTRATALADTLHQQREAEQQREAAATQAREADKHTWITAHGSDFLRRACLAGGYDCQRRYVEERAALEFPGYVVDFKDYARWRDRSCPSEVALAEAERVSGLVVWLTASPEEDENDLDPCEAVVVRGYLDKYDLIREV